MKVAKNYQKKVEAYNRQEMYAAEDAMKIVVKNATAKFDETVEVHIKLGVDGTKADQQVRGTVVLPAGTGKKVKVLVIAKGDKADEAKKAGADIVGGDEMIAKIAGGFLDFDVCITTPDMMPMLGRVARQLGPKGLMPNPKSGTVTTDIKKAVDDVKGGKVEYRLDKQNIVHTILGKASFGDKKLMQNYDALIAAIIKAKPSAAKGVYLKSITVTSTMGPGVKVKPIV
ncbi:MAG: 50S ribosomal protein L1 [Firmicutes bacterium]|nr:50S ribosomal protein L1 [Bacillota bacterium]MCL2771014.1 50S ribosomal protein L1 [Bacillota bacterium]